MCPVKGFCFVLRTAFDQNLGAKKTNQNKTKNKNGFSKQICENVPGSQNATTILQTQVTKLLRMAE